MITFKFEVSDKAYREMRKRPRADQFKAFKRHAVREAKRVIDETDFEFAGMHTEHIEMMYPRTEFRLVEKRS